MLSCLKPEKTVKSRVEKVLESSIEHKFVVDYFKTTSGNLAIKVANVEKIYNKKVQMRFINELKIVQEKNPHLDLKTMLRVLWHGTSKNDPLTIAQSESGLDMRYANAAGYFGSGIYFADTAEYSLKYAHQVANV